MKNEEAKELLSKYQTGDCTPEEEAIIEAWFLDLNEDLDELPPKTIERMGRQVLANLPGKGNRTLGKGPDYLILAIAASFILSLGAWLYFGKLKVNSQAANSATELLPGGNRAMLTLSNGNRIQLSSRKRVLFVNRGNITYDDGSSISQLNEQVADTAQQIISTPKGGQYQLVLSDGTRIWMNAATTIKFPKSFNNLKERRIDLNGEAYFEVAKDRHHPFIVTSSLQQIRVLGTHFNISAYPDEQVTKSTLLEGRILIDNRTILNPGEQATKKVTGIHVDQVDTDYAVAWKNGEFMFRNEPLENIMKKISRWYNVDIAFENSTLGKKLFGGEISRFTNVSEVLNMLQLTGQVHFKIEGRRIMVLNK